jgi:hypothetical protein
VDDPRDGAARSAAPEGNSVPRDPLPPAEAWLAELAVTVALDERARLIRAVCHLQNDGQYDGPIPPLRSDSPIALPAHSDGLPARAPDGDASES